VLDARDVLDAVLGMTLVPAAVHRPGQRHLAVADHHLDLRGVDMRVVGQAVADILADALVGTGIADRTAATVLADGGAAALLAVAAAPALAEPAVARGAVGAEIAAWPELLVTIAAVFAAIPLARAPPELLTPVALSAEIAAVASVTRTVVGAVIAPTMAPAVAGALAAVVAAVPAANIATAGPGSAFAAIALTSVAFTAVAATEFLTAAVVALPVLAAIAVVVLVPVIVIPPRTIAVVSALVYHPAFLLRCRLAGIGSDASGRRRDAMRRIRGSVTWFPG
jgi:hypothetical protein